MANDIQSLKTKINDYEVTDPDRQLSAEEYNTLLAEVQRLSNRDAISQYALHYIIAPNSGGGSDERSFVLAEPEDKKAENLKVVEYLVSLGIDASKESVKCIIVQSSGEEDALLAIDAQCQYSEGGILLVGVDYLQFGSGFELYVSYEPIDDGTFNYFGQLNLVDMPRLNDNGRLDPSLIEDKSIDESKLSDDVIEKFYDPTLYCTITKDSSGVLSLSTDDVQAQENIKNIKRIQPSLTDPSIHVSPRLTFVYDGVVFNVEPKTNAFLFSADNYFPKCTGQFIFDGVAYDYSIVFNYNNGIIRSATLTKRISNITTPSGHPLHDSFVLAGGVWTPYDQLPDRLKDERSLANGGYWSYRVSEGGLEDITTEEFAKAYAFDPVLSQMVPIAALHSHPGLKYIAGYGYWNAHPRFNIINCRVSGAADYGSILQGLSSTSSNNMEVAWLGSAYHANATNIAYLCRYNSSLKRLNCEYINIQWCTAATKVNYAFEKCESLEYLHLKNIPISISLKDCKNLANESILYMVSNVLATATNVVLTLHPESYARAMADPEIVAALEAHTNISLASA